MFYELQTNLMVVVILQIMLDFVVGFICDCYYYYITHNFLADDIKENSYIDLEVLVPMKNKLNTIKLLCVSPIKRCSLRLLYGTTPSSGAPLVSLWRVI